MFVLKKIAFLKKRYHYKYQRVYRTINKIHISIYEVTDTRSVRKNPRYKTVSRPIIIV